LRYASRLAGRLNRNWYALYVQTPSEDPARVDAATRSALSEALALAGQLGAMVFTFKGDDVVDTILRFAREYRVGHLVVGRPTPRPLWKRLSRGRLDLPRLVAAARGLAVVVVDASLGGALAAATAPAPPPQRPPGLGREREARPEPKPLARPVAAASAPLSTYLAEPAILVFSAPVGKSELLARLVAAVAGGFPVDAADILRRVERREAEASTFLSEG